MKNIKYSLEDNLWNIKFAVENGIECNTDDDIVDNIFYNTCIKIEDNIGRDIAGNISANIQQNIIISKQKKIKNIKNDINNYMGENLWFNFWNYNTKDESNLDINIWYYVEENAAEKIWDSIGIATDGIWNNIGVGTWNKTGYNIAGNRINFSTFQNVLTTNRP